MSSACTNHDNFATSVSAGSRLIGIVNLTHFWVCRPTCVTRLDRRVACLSGPLTSCAHKPVPSCKELAGTQRRVWLGKGFATVVKARIDRTRLLLGFRPRCDPDEANHYTVKLSPFVGSANLRNPVEKFTLIAWYATSCWGVLRHSGVPGWQVILHNLATK